MMDTGEQYSYWSNLPSTRNEVNQNNCSIIPENLQVTTQNVTTYNTNNSISTGSSSSTTSSFNQPSPNNVVRTRRPKAGSVDEKQTCVVCGEHACGYNFDQLTCESCKAFFRRNALKPADKIKPCSRDGNCEVSGCHRKHCPSCRLEKCLRSGMKRELILPPEKLENRAKPKRRRKSIDANVATESVTSTLSTNENSNKSGQTSSAAVTMDNEQLAHLKTTQSHSVHATNAYAVYNSLNSGYESTPSYNDSGMEKMEIKTNGANPFVNNAQMTSSDTQSSLPELYFLWSKSVTSLEELLLTSGDISPLSLTTESLCNRMDSVITFITNLAKNIPGFNEFPHEYQSSLVKKNIFGLILIVCAFLRDSDFLLRDLSYLEANGEIEKLSDKDRAFLRYRQKLFGLSHELNEAVMEDSYLKVCVFALRLFNTEDVEETMLTMVQCSHLSVLRFMRRHITAVCSSTMSAARYSPHVALSRLHLALAQCRPHEARLRSVTEFLRKGHLLPLMQGVFQTD